MPGLTIGDTLPDLEVQTTHGNIKLHEYCSNANFTIIFSHPGDFTPVCTTELGAMAVYADKFEQRGVKLLGFSCDDVQSHQEWIKDIEAYNKNKPVNYPIAADPSREIIKKLNMVEPTADGNTAPATPSRALHIVGPDKKIKVSFLYPASTGRNMDEVLRVLDSLDMASKHKIATPANWKPGDSVVISPDVSSDEAKQSFTQGYDSVELPSNKDYLRFTHVA
ncbi:1-Cys peroxiredoxin-like [Dorcoceras hygrometricum]|uniref:Peroxiredoxin n=1 Tax=Dorcoceras hygrometricum TaxID=472368 RepID=A0A2Z7DE34_9LAMI|nr:1-Cys peroxiredoxin-like [Dorcoceras hygrometricum]